MLVSFLNYFEEIDMTITPLAGFTLAATMIATGAAAQDDAMTLPIRELDSKYELVDADAENGLATIAQGDYKRTLDCEDLAYFQERTETDAFESISRYFSFGSANRRSQVVAMELAFGHISLNDAWELHSELIGDDENLDYAVAAQYGAERKVFIDAQIEAGCFTPKGVADRGLPRPSR